MPTTAKIAIMVNVASVGFAKQEVQFSPKIFPQKSFQPGIGKLAISRKKDPTISSGMDSRKPSRIAIRYLFFPIFSARGMSTDSNLLNIEFSPNPKSDFM